jgi:hypothetical protein
VTHPDHSEALERAWATVRAACSGWSGAFEQKAVAAFNAINTERAALTRAEAENRDLRKFEAAIRAYFRADHIEVALTQYHPTPEYPAMDPEHEAQHVAAFNEIAAPWDEATPETTIEDRIAWCDDSTPETCKTCGWPPNEPTLADASITAIECPGCRRMRQTYTADEGTSGFLPFHTPTGGDHE